jgi:hypothetical protein
MSSLAVAEINMTNTQALEIRGLKGQWSKLPKQQRVPFSDLTIAGTPPVTFCGHGES